MEGPLNQVMVDTSEIDSELLKDKTQVLGVLAADQQGLCLVSQGSIDSKLSNIAASLANVSKELDPEQMLPTIVLESNARKLIVKQEDDVIVAILKKSPK